MYFAMIKRIVMMQLLPEHESLFKGIFEGAKQQIRSQPGCEGVELLRSSGEGFINIWTISLWHSEEALNAYRDTDLFLTTWKAVKPLFTAKTKAWTLTSLDLLP